MVEVSICPFCGESSVTMDSMDGYDFRCGTFVSTMRIELTYHQSDRCKENIKKKEVENANT